MAESLRDLVVSLSLNSDNFTRNIKSVNKQIQEAESRFKLAASGNEGFEKTIAGMSAKSDMLERKLKLQKDAVKQYEGALKAANAKLQECYTRQETYSQKLEQAKAAQSRIADSISKVSAAYEKYKNELGESDSATVAAKEKLEQLQTKYKDATKEVEKLAGQEDALKRATQNAADAVSTAEKNLNNANAALKETEAELKKTNQALITAKSHWTQAGEAMQTFGKKCKEIGSNAENIGRTLTRTVTTPILGLGAAALKASIDFESTFTSVRKTVDATEEQFGHLQEASKRMSTELAASTSEINEVMATGGQLGIGWENLEAFTKIMIDLGNSCEDLTAGDAATSLAKFANVMGSGQDQFDKMGATLVDLGNNYATTERAIMEMSQRLAGAGHQVGLTEAEVMGFAAALSSVGIEAQMGGSAFSKALVKMDVAVATGNDDLKSFADICGLTTNQFKEMWKSDPAGVFNSFITGLSGMNEEGISAIAVLQEIGISEIRLRDTLLRATNASELFTSAQTMAKKAWKDNSALTTEANKRYGTTASKITNLKNKATLFAQTLGDDLNPMIQNVIGGVGDFIDRLNNMDSAGRTAIVTIAGIAAAVGPAFLLFGKVTKAVGESSEAFGKIAVSIGQKMTALKGSVAAAGGGLKGLISVVASSPVAWAALAAGVAYGLYKLHDFVSGAKAAREAQENLNETVKQWGENVRTGFEEAKGLSTFGLTNENFNNKNTGESWLQRTLAEWNDGKKETKETVNSVVSEFKDGTNKIREHLNGLKEAAGGGSFGDLDKDIKELDKIDKQIEKLMNKRKNKNLTEKDINELQSLIDQRDALQIKYKLVADSDTAFDSIVDGVEAALSRGADSANTFNEAYAAATQGLGSYIDSLNEEYDARYKILQAMDDSTPEGAAAKAAEMEKLAAWYAEQKAAATQKYYETLAQISGQTGVFEEGGKYDETIEKLKQIDELMKAAAGKDAKSEEMTALSNALADLQGDEASIVEMAAAIAAMKAAAEEAGVEVPESVKAAEEALKSVMTTATETKNTFSEGVQESIKEMFGGVDEEVHEVYATLNCDNLSTAYDAWAAGVHADIIPGLQTTGLDISEVPLTGSVTAIHDGENVVVDISSLDALTGEVTIIKDGVTQKVKISELEGLTGTVTGVVEGQNVRVVIGTLDKLKGTVTVINDKGEATEVSISQIQDLKAYVSAVTDKGKQVSVDLTTLNALEGTVTVYDDKGKASTVKLSSLKGLEGQVIGYDEEGNAITFHASALSDMTGTVVGFSISPEAKVPEVPVKGVINFEEGKYSNSGNPALEFTAAESKTNTGFMGMETFSFKEEIRRISDYAKALENVKEKREALAKAKENGDWESQIFAQQDLETAENALRDFGQILSTYTDDGGRSFETVAQYVASGLQLMANGQMSPEEMQEFTTNYQALIDILNGSDGVIDEGVGSEFAAGLSEWLTNSEGWKTAPETLLETLKTAFSSAEENFKQLGKDTGAGIGQGQAEHDFSGDAEVSIANLIEADRNAADSHSPAKKFNPIGDDIGAGIGEGMAMHDFTAEAAATAGNILSAMTSALSVDLLSPIGRTAIVGLCNGMLAANVRGTAMSVGNSSRMALASAMSPGSFTGIGRNAMRGLAAGITAGKSSVVNAMKEAARSAVQAAKRELKIKSPSRVFRDEVGVMTMKGFTEGIQMESKASAKAIKNAARYLTGEAKDGAMNYGSSDNSKTYNSTNSVNVTGNNFYVEDKQDIQSLAVEIASMTRRNQRGRGLRSI